MRAAGCHLYQDYRHMAFMGFIAVLRNLGRVRRNFHIAHRALLAERPDVLVLVDYPSFNLKIAAFCRRHLPDTRIIYYIPPKVWAWKKWRIHRIAQLCDAVLGIFPFEPSFYAQYGYTCTYVGNPTVDALATWQQQHSLAPSASPADTIAILPGSRPAEISHCIERMLLAGSRFPDYEMVVTMAPGINDDFYTPYIDAIRRKGARVRTTRDTYAAVSVARAAIVNSGTATLETALLGCPQVAVYHVGLSALIGRIRGLQKYIFRLPYFTLVNIIPNVPNEAVIRELLADDFTTDRVATELDRLLHDEPYRRTMLQRYAAIRQILGTAPAAETAAKKITRPC